MWQRFSSNARKAVFFDQEEAQMYGEGYVSTEHLLLGTLRLKDCTALTWLNAVGVTPESVKRELLQHLSEGHSDAKGDMTLTPRAKRVIDHANSEARLLKSITLGTEHLLLGIVLESGGFGGRVLHKLGVQLDALRKQAGVNFESPRDTVSEDGRPMGSAERTLALILADPTSTVTALFAQGGFDPVEFIGRLESSRAYDRASFRDILSAAEAARSELNAVDLTPDHLALAILRHGDSLAAHTLVACGVDERTLLSALSGQ